MSGIKIVHPHTPETDRLARLLRKEFYSYRIPRDVQRKTGLRRLEDAGGSWLVVLCTPETKEDPEIIEEIKRYPGRILTLLVCGTPEESFPDILLHEVLPDGTAVDREPLAANLSDVSGAMQARKLRVERLRLLAPVLGVSFDELRNRRRLQRQRFLYSAGAAVLAAAAIFLGYALNRVHVLSGQNTQLKAHLAEEEEALREARTQQAAAEADFARLTAEKAAKLLAEGETELAALLCLELFPEAEPAGDAAEGRHDTVPGGDAAEGRHDTAADGDLAGERADTAQVEELAAVLRDTAQVLSQSGYVPMGKGNTYTMHRYGTSLPERNSSLIKLLEDPGRKLFQTTIYRKAPQEESILEGYARFTLSTYDAELRAGIYHGYLAQGTYTSAVCSLVHFPDDPDKDYLLRDEAGHYIQADSPVFLPDHSVVGKGNCSDIRAQAKSEGPGWETGCLRFDLDTGRLRAVLDEPSGEEAETGTAGEEAETEPAGNEKEALLARIERFKYFEGMDRVLGVTASGDLEVFSREPLAWLETIEDVGDLQSPHSCSYLFSNTPDMKVFTKVPFAYCYTLPAGFYNPKSGDSPDILEKYGLILYKYRVFDLKTGEQLYDLRDFGDNLNGEGTFSSDGWLRLSIGDDSCFLDPVSGEIKGKVPMINVYFYGDWDPESGRMSAKAVRGSSGAWMVYRYFETAEEVPEQPEELAAMVRRRIGDIALTKAERKEYKLDTR